MFNRLQRLAADHPATEVDTGVLMARGQEPEEGELDVALMCGSQLHVFEMKGALDVQRARWLQQVGDWGIICHGLCGTGCGSWSFRSRRLIIFRL
jgi:hypothetical protein